MKNLPRSIVKSLGCLAAVGLLSTALAQAEPKIALIDLKKVFDGYYKTKQADAQLKERAGDFDKMRKGMLDDYQKGVDEYKKLMEGVTDQALSTEERDKRKTAAEKKMLEIRQVEQDLAQFDKTSRTTLGEQQRRMRDRILEEIRELVNQQAKQKGYTLVFDIAADSVNQTPVLLYHTGENDMTQPVLAELNAKMPLELPAQNPAPDTTGDSKK
jgi:outer membrane protein